MKNYLKQATPVARETLAVTAGTSVAYLYLICGGHRRAGPELCKKLVAAEPKLTLPELRPDIWGVAQEVAPRRAADSAPDPDHAGRQPPATNAIANTLPMRATVGIEMGAKP